MSEKPYDILEVAILRVLVDYGIKIENIDIRWIDISTLDKRDSRLKEIRINGEVT